MGVMSKSPKKNVPISQLGYKASRGRRWDPSLDEDTGDNLEPMAEQEPLGLEGPAPRIGATCFGVFRRLPRKPWKM